MSKFWRGVFWFIFLVVLGLWILAIFNQRAAITFLPDFYHQLLQEYSTVILDNFPIVLSLTALLFSYKSLEISHERTEIARKQLEEAQTEKAERRLSIVLTDAFKEDDVLDNNIPLEWWALKLLVTNKSEEQVILIKLHIELETRKAVNLSPLEKMIQKSPLEPFQHSGNIAERKAYAIYDMSLHDTQRISTKSVGYIPTSDASCFSTANLINWNTREPILFTPLEEKYGPNPGEKQSWLLFGKTTPEFQTFLHQHQLELHRINCTFTTDKGEEVIEFTFPLRARMPYDLKDDLVRMSATEEER